MAGRVSSNTPQTGDIGVCKGVGASMLAWKSAFLMVCLGLSVIEGIAGRVLECNGGAMCRERALQTGCQSAMRVLCAG